MFKWFFKKKVKEVEVIQNPITVHADVNFPLNNILMVGEFLGRYSGSDFEVYHYSEAVKVWGGHAEKIIKTLIKNEGLEWDFKSLSEHKDERVRALVASNGKFLIKLVNDKSYHVLKEVLFKATKHWRPDRVERILQGFYTSLLRIEEKYPQKFTFTSRCPCCGEKRKKFF